MHNRCYHYPLVSASALAVAVCFAPAFEFSIGVLLSNYPNPFNSRKTSTNIVVSVSYLTAVPLNIRICDSFGNLVREFDGIFSSQFQWGGKDERGNFVSKGGYLCVVLTGKSKMVALRKIGVIH